MWMIRPSNAARPVTLPRSAGTNSTLHNRVKRVVFGES